MPRQLWHMDIDAGSQPCSRRSHDTHRQRPLPMSPRELSEAPPWPRANVTGGRVPRREGVWADRGAIDTPSAAVTKADRQPTALRDIGVVT